MAGLTGVHAQEPPGFSTLSITLGPESRNVFLIDANEHISLTLQTERRDLRLVLQDPKGMVWEIVSQSAEGAPMNVYGATIKAPAPGFWTLTALASRPLTNHPSAPLTIDYANRVRARIAISRRTFVTGGPLPVTLVLMDGFNRVKGLRTQVSMTRVDAPASDPIPVTFRDDGSLGDQIARDGLYTALIPTETPGSYRLDAQVEGLASSGPCHRSAGTTFRVVMRAARLTGTILQRVLPENPE